MLAHVSAYWIRQPKIALVVESNGLESKLLFRLSFYFSSLFPSFEHLLQLYMWEINPKKLRASKYNTLFSCCAFYLLQLWTWTSAFFLCVCVRVCACVCIDRPAPLPVVWYAAAVPGWAEAGAVPRLPGSPDNEGHWEHHHHRGGESQWNVWELSRVWGRWVLSCAGKKWNQATKCNIVCRLTMNEWSISSFCLLQVGGSRRSGEKNAKNAVNSTINIYKWHLFFDLFY